MNVFLHKPHASRAPNLIFRSKINHFQNNTSFCVTSVNNIDQICIIDDQSFGMNNFFSLKYQIKWKFGQNHENGPLPYGQLRKFMNGQKSKNFFSIQYQELYGFELQIRF